MEYAHCLAAIGPNGKARNTVGSYKNAVQRKSNAINTVHECSGSRPNLPLFSQPNLPLLLLFPLPLPPLLNQPLSLC